MTPSLATTCLVAVCSANAAQAFSLLLPQKMNILHTQRTLTHHCGSRVNEEAQESETVSESQQRQIAPDQSSSFQQNFSNTLGTVDLNRIIYPEYDTGEVPRLLSTLEYNEDAQGRLQATHAPGSVVGATTLIAGTMVGAGVLALPTATAAAGFVPSSLGLIVAWVYMTMSGLLIAELTLNRMGETGRPGLGLLELYENSLGPRWSKLGSAAYFFVHYSVMVAYIAQGGSNVDALLHTQGVGPWLFTAACGVSLYAAQPAEIEKVNNVLVFGVAATFFGIIGIGVGTADFTALIDPENQHFDQVASCFPILFLAQVYHNVVPTVVAKLEGDRTKIKQAIVAGTCLPLLMFLAWNAIVFGNVMGTGMIDGVDPLAILQSGAVGSELLGPLVSVFSSLALVTSIIGFTYGLVDAWGDVFKLNPQDMKKNKAPLYALIYGPPLALSLANPSIFYTALEYGGAFGVSTLFLVLPPLMVWKERYGDEASPLMTRPMVPFGKLSLMSMWKAAGALILEQGAEKLGVLDKISEFASHIKS